MKPHRSSGGRVLVLSAFLVLSQVATAGAAAVTTSRPIERAEELKALCDPSLEGLRGGRSRQSDRLREDDRKELLAAQDRSPELLDLRAGGAVEILLVVAIVLLILIVL